MPLYEYVCNACEQEFETLVQTGEEPECPECQSHDLERLLSVPGAPKVNGTSGLPMSGCRTDLPPCGPGCCRM